MFRDDPKPGLAEARYRALEKKRQPYLDEGRRAAALTIPWVCPPSSYRRSHAALPKPNQGLGARGVANLTGKFMTVLMPPGMPFFKVGLQPNVETEIAAKGEGGLGEVQLALSKHEMDIVTAIAQDGDRAGVVSGFLHLPITGNVLLHELDKGGVEHFGLDQYVARRGKDGSTLEIIVCEPTAFEELHEDHLRQIKVETDEEYDDDDVIEVFTRIYLKDSRYYSYQEAKGVILEDSDAEWPKDACPWIPLRWSHVAGESYGRGLIELIYKDLKRFDELSKAIGDAAKNAAKLIWMTQGGGAGALVQRLSKAESGDFVVGDAANVKALQQEKAADLQVAIKEQDSLRTSLSMTFLMGTALQRGGDRVTKFEVEYFARELEGTYANEYTIIGKEFQEPYFKMKTAQLVRRNVIPRLPEKAVKVEITTGIDALGRGSDQMRLETFAELAVKSKDLPEDRLNPREFLRRSAANLTVKPDGLIPTEEEVAAMRAREQQAQMASAVVPEMVRNIGQAGLQQQAAALEQQANPQTPPEGGPVE